MLLYVIRRTLYALLVVVGVLVVTFVLFGVTAGDPVASVLGKNARPDEIEALRVEIGADLPLFYGEYCPTESYGAFDAVDGKIHKDVSIKKIFTPPPNLVARIGLNSGKEVIVNVKSEYDEFFYRAPDGDGVASVRFFRVQDNPYNSRFLRTISEIVSFSEKYPFVSFLHFGRTITTGEDISTIMARSIVPSLMLMVPIFIGETFLGIIISLISAVMKNKKFDKLLVVFTVCGMSISYLVIIVFAQYFLGYYLQLFPIWGFQGYANIVLPIIVGIFCGLGANIRFYRAVFVDELQKDYLRTVAAKGGNCTRMYCKHVLRNASLQVVTRASASLPFLFTGSLLLESFFGIPGLGFVGVEALYNSEIQLIKAIVVIGALLFVVINLLCDLVYAWADPRVRQK